MERPDLRRFAFNPLEAVKANRERYIGDVLTILRSFIGAGCPGADELTPFGGFKQWSRRVRGALIWLGMTDPLESIENVRSEDPVLKALEQVLGTWHASLGRRAVTTPELKRECDRAPELHEALSEVAGDRRGAIGNRQLGEWLKARQGRRASGLLLESCGERQRYTLWRVVETGPYNGSNNSVICESGESRESFRPKGPNFAASNPNEKSGRLGVTDSPDSHTPGPEEWGIL